VSTSAGLLRVRWLKKEEAAAAEDELLDGRLFTNLRATMAYMQAEASTQYSSGVSTVYVVFNCTATGRGQTFTMIDPKGTVTASGRTATTKCTKAKWICAMVLSESLTSTKR
jgi:hypothetical protein